MPLLYHILATCAKWIPPFREILNRIVYETDAGGEVITQRAAASSINLPVIAEQPTHQQMASLMQRLLKTSDEESVRRQLRTAFCDIKALYTETTTASVRPEESAGRIESRFRTWLHFLLQLLLRGLNPSTLQLYRHRCHGAGSPGLRRVYPFQLFNNSTVQLSLMGQGQT